MAGPTTSSAARTPPASVSRSLSRRGCTVASRTSAVRSRTAIPCPAGGSISPRNISWVRRRPRSTNHADDMGSARRCRIHAAAGRGRFRSKRQRRRRRDPQCGRPPRTPPGITLCRSSSREHSAFTEARRSLMARRYRSKPPNPPPRSAMRPRTPSSSTAGPSSTAFRDPSMPSRGAASPSASSGTAIAATTTPISISSASPCRSPCPASRASMAASGAFAPISATAPNWNWCCPRARKPSRTIS